MARVLKKEHEIKHLPKSFECIHTHIISVATSGGPLRIHHGRRKIVMIHLKILLKRKGPRPVKCVLMLWGCGREDAQWRQIHHFCAFTRVSILSGNVLKEKNRNASWVMLWQRRRSWRVKCTLFFCLCKCVCDGNECDFFYISR